jgi:hypothetical protein
MTLPVSSRPVDLLRASSDQIRRAAILLAQLTEDTAGGVASGPELPPWTGPVDESEAVRESTIQQAQRSFVAGLKPKETPPPDSMPAR